MSFQKSLRRIKKKIISSFKNFLFTFFFNLKIKKIYYSFCSLLPKYFVKKKYLVFVNSLNEDFKALNEQKKQKINKKAVDLFLLKKRVI